MPVVGLHRALAGPHPLAVEPEQAEVERYFSMPGQLVRAARVAGRLDSDDPMHTLSARGNRGGGAQGPRRSPFGCAGCAGTPWGGGKAGGPAVSGLTGEPRAGGSGQSGPDC